MPDPKQPWPEPLAVQEVRQWRQKMVKSWEGKSREEIRAELNERARRFEEARRERPARKG